MDVSHNAGTGRATASNTSEYCICMEHKLLARHLPGKGKKEEGGAVLVDKKRFIKS